MATKSVVCPECDSALPYGRLACPSCGTLLASVAGAPRRAARVEAPVPGADASAVPVSTILVADDPGAASSLSTWDSTDEVEDDAPEGRTDDGHEGWADEEAVAEPGDAAEAPEAHVPAVPSPAPAEPDWPTREPEWPTREPEWPTREPEWPTREPAQPWWTGTAQPARPTETVEAASSPPTTERPWPTGDPEPSSSPAPAASTMSSSTNPGAGTPALAFEPAGAYLPPSAVFAPPAPEEAAAPERAGALRRGQASLLADLRFDAPADLPGWLVAAGSAMASAGFLLPWAPQLIGSAGVGGYLDRWGLGAPMHLPVFVLGLVVLALAIVPNRIPAWIRAGVVPIALGGLLLGLVWPYLVGPFDGALGAMAEAIGAVLLVVGGIVATRQPRHDREPPSV